MMTANGKVGGERQLGGGEASRKRAGGDLGWVHVLHVPKVPGEGRYYYYYDRAMTLQDSL